jgi:hypothetical protein
VKTNPERKKKIMKNRKEIKKERKTERKRKEESLGQNLKNSARKKFCALHGTLLGTVTVTKFVLMLIYCRNKVQLKSYFIKYSPYPKTL